jgi:hypothetical protein
VLPLVPEAREIERQLLAYPPDIAQAWLVDQFYSKRHYHPYNMHERLFLLIARQFGRRALAVVKDRINEGGPQYTSHHFLGYAWQQGVDTARELLGPDFPRWYRKATGRSYDDDVRRHAAAEAKDPM